MKIQPVEQVNFGRQVIPPKKPKRLLIGIAAFGAGCYTGCKIKEKNKNARKQWSCSVERRYQ